MASADFLRLEKVHRLQNEKKRFSGKNTIVKLFFSSIELKKKDDE